MAYKNKTIGNTKTGMQVKFLQTAIDTNGALLEMEATYSPRSKEPVPHYHPFQKEDYTIVLGEFTVRIDNTLKVLTAGETLHIPAGKLHSAWNNTDGITVMNWKVQPAMNTDHFLETVTGLANAGKTNDNGMPSLLQNVLIADYFYPIFRVVNPPEFLQRLLFPLLVFVAKLNGYKAVYKEYID